MRVASLLLCGLAVLSAPLLSSVSASSLVSSSEYAVQSHGHSHSHLRRRHHQSAQRRMQELEQEMERLREFLDQSQGQSADSDEADFSEAGKVTAPVAAKAATCLSVEVVEAALEKARDAFVKDMEIQSAKYSTSHKKAAAKKTEDAESDDAEESEESEESDEEDASAPVKALPPIIAVPVQAVRDVANAALCVTFWPILKGLSPNSPPSFVKTCLEGKGGFHLVDGRNGHGDGSDE